jgi:hypothetical protein
MSDTWLNSYITGVTDSLATKLQDALLQITDQKRRLLAIRGYLRTKRNIETDWAWSNEQANDFRESIAGEDLVVQIARVKDEFAKANAGYALSNSKLVRTFERQVQLWNDNASVGTAASMLWSLAQKEVNSSKLKQPLGTTQSQPTTEQVAEFTRFLKKTYPGEIMVATPGLSDHGHADAVDFVVIDAKTKAKVAGTSKAHIEPIWEKKGYTQALKAAVVAAGNRFTGPLASPYEPWHYNINWETDAMEVPRVPKCSRGP